VFASAKLAKHSDVDVNQINLAIKTFLCLPAMTHLICYSDNAARRRKRAKEPSEDEKWRMLMEKRKEVSAPEDNDDDESFCARVACRRGSSQSVFS